MTSIPEKFRVGSFYLKGVTVRLVDSLTTLTPTVSADNFSAKWAMSCGYKCIANKQIMANILSQCLLVGASNKDEWTSNKVSKQRLTLFSSSSASWFVTAVLLLSVPDTVNNMTPCYYSSHWNASYPKTAPEMGRDVLFLHCNTKDQSCSINKYLFHYNIW